MINIEEQLFNDATELLGNPIKEWQFTGIEFNDEQPHLRYFPSEGHIKISLSFKAKNDYQQYVFQLSHELCHLFYPKIEYPSLIEHSTLVINEGISTYFSIKNTGLLFNMENELINNLKEHSPKYYNAFNLVSQLLDSDNHAIKKLRSHQPRIDLLKAKDFIEADINANEELIILLVEHFK